MLDSETKRRIDAARQVLVGVVPNPTSQVEQITNALLYKFMDDMDQAAIKVGGKPSFFTDDLEHYAWARIMRRGVGNQERMNLYGEALTKFSQAKQLPELFREIFADAFLPYRSPETLGLFLKEIDYFDYSHPEELGNAYEYLLLIMASQGDAGQFRTPRNIIDFIVDVVNPTKDDKILDPACGTGGFLVSSYKRILQQHDGKDDPEKKEKPLTPDERKKLMDNIEGYDIDPGMARIARVNMYLHRFKNPRIHRYDTLSSDERWRDKFSVILANPPFMSPRGGIRPHDRFSIKSSRSEVLFVDYIMSHLRPNGRAGIIVPEGIIFQSSTAYKELREKLIKDGLYAVVSLPGGVFQPYSGVKTSILLFNNEVARQRNKILFVKVENDGFALGATRQPIDKDDLPVALDILNKWLTGEKSNSKLSLYVEKTKIAEDGEYNLSGDRYRETVDYSNVKWPMVELSEIFEEIKNGKNVSQFTEVGKYRVSRIQTIADGRVDLAKTKYTNDEVEENDFLKNGDILFSHINSFAHLAKTAIFVNISEKVVHGANLIRLRPNKNKIVPKYAIYIFKTKKFIDNARRYAQKAVNQASINTTAIKSFKIPLPPIEIQEQVVSEIDQHQRVIDGAKQVVHNWKPYFRIDPEWPMVELGEIAEYVNGFAFKPEDWHGSGTPIVRIQNLTGSSGSSINRTERKDVPQKYIIENGDLLISWSATIGFFIWDDGKAYLNQHIFKVLPKENLLKEYLYYLRSQIVQEIKRKVHGNTMTHITKGTFNSIKIPLPPFKVQEQIVAEIKVEQKAIDESKNLIGVMKKKIESKIAEVWGA